jgi:hypothetical protein
MPHQPVVSDVRIRDFRVISRLNPRRVPLPDRRGQWPRGARRSVIAPRPQRAAPRATHVQLVQLCQRASVQLPTQGGGSPMIDMRRRGHVALR